MQVTAGGGGGQLPNAGNIILSGGTLSYFGNGSASPGETAGALLLNPGQSTITTTNAGTSSTYLCFASGAPSAVVGETVNFAGSNNAQIQFQSNPPNGNGSIIGGYAFYISGSNTDFAVLTAGISGGPYTVGAYSGYTAGNLVSCGTTANAKPSGAQSSLSTATTINSLNLAGTTGVTMTGTGTLTLNSGGLIANTSGNFTGGTLMGSSSGELTINTVQSLTIGSVIADNGGPTALVKTGSGTLTLTNPSTFSGNIFLNQGTLAYSLSNNLSYGGAISGIGGLSKSGSAALTLTGSNTYSGPTTISQGNLVVNGELLSSGNIQVNNATLAGTGSVGNVFVNGGGTLAVGDGANTMSVAALTPSATSFLNICTNAAGYNPLAVSGVVALPNSGVTLNLTNGSNASGTYHLMSYGSLSGLSLSTFTITGSPLAGDKFTIMADSGSTNYLDLVIDQWNVEPERLRDMERLGQLGQQQRARRHRPGLRRLRRGADRRHSDRHSGQQPQPQQPRLQHDGRGELHDRPDQWEHVDAGQRGGAATLSDSGGRQTISAPIVLAGNLIVTATAGSSR